MEQADTNAPPTSPHRRPGNPADVFPLALWLGLQLLALLLPVLQVPLSDEFPRPIERLALHEMLAVQIGCAALLFPLLLRSVNSSLMVIATSWPFLLLAGFLAATPLRHVATAGAYLSGWMLVVGLWRFSLASHRSQLAGVAIATTIAVGGALLAYLQAEFGSAPPPAMSAIDFTPMLAAWRLSAEPAAFKMLPIWMPLLAAGLPGGLLPLFIRRKLRALAPSYPQSSSRPINRDIHK